MSRVEVAATDDMPTDAKLSAGTVGRAVADVVHAQIVERPPRRERRAGRMDRTPRVAGDVVTDLEPGERDVVHAVRRHDCEISPVRPVENYRAGERVTRLRGQRPVVRPRQAEPRSGRLRVDVRLTRAHQNA